jgi:serine/threonine protein kinase
MESEKSSHLFVSYAHDDESDMFAFRKHLRGMLHNEADVWSDLDISKGAIWESILTGSLNQANSALVLASPDYLISSWCRAELQQLSEAKRAGRLRNLFWVQLKPCGWQHTELQHYQAFASEQAINEYPDEMGRQRAILQACERIAAEIIRSSTDKDRELAFVRRILSTTEHRNLTVDSVLHSSSFSIVCHGFEGSTHVTVKVLRFVPLKGLADTLLKIGSKRQELQDPSFKRIHKIFPSGGDGEQRIVMVSDYVGNAKLLSTFLDNPDPKQPAFTINRVVRLLRRMAEGLSELHGNIDEKDENAWQSTLGLLTPDDIFYDPASGRLTVSPIGISSFLWHTLDSGKYVDWVDKKTACYVVPEQSSPGGQRLTPRSDQYMLGRLGVEMLEGLRFEKVLARSQKPLNESLDQFWRDPKSLIGGDWNKHHPQLRDIILRLLQREPRRRFSAMDEVVQKLSSVEESERALAKSVYVPLMNEAPGKLDVKFFKQFYKTFFERSPDSEAKFDKVPDPHVKLMKAMAAVLNFRNGNSPTSLEAIVESHREHKITKAELKAFNDSFLETMRRLVGDAKVQEAWENLLKPVIEYMELKCVGVGEAADGGDQNAEGSQQPSPPH